MQKKAQNSIQYKHSGGTIVGEEHFSSDDDSLSSVILKALLDIFS